MCPIIKLITLIIKLFPFIFQSWLCLKLLYCRMEEALGQCPRCLFTYSVFFRREFCRESNLTLVKAFSCVLCKVTMWEIELVDCFMQILAQNPHCAKSQSGQIMSSIFPFSYSLDRNKYQFLIKNVYEMHRMDF